MEKPDFYHGGGIGSLEQSPILFGGCDMKGSFPPRTPVLASMILAGSLRVCALALPAEIGFLRSCSLELDLDSLGQLGNCKAFTHPPMIIHPQFESAALRERVQARRGSRLDIRAWEHLVELKCL